MNSRSFIVSVPAVLALFLFITPYSSAQGTSGNEGIRFSEEALKGTRTVNKTIPGPQRPEIPQTPEIPKMPETPQGYKNKADLFGPQSPVRPQGPIR